MAKREMLPVRMDAHAKHTIESAAALMGTTVNSFLLHHAYQAAIEILKENHLALDDYDWDNFIEALENPPKANAQLKRLLRRDA